MKGVSTKLILTVVIAGLVIGFISVLASKVVKKASIIGVRDIGGKFSEDGFVMSAKKEIDLRDVKVYMKRFEIEKEEVEILEGVLAQFDLFRYDYPHKDIELVIIYYYGPDDDGEFEWRPYHLHNYEFE